MSIKLNGNSLARIQRGNRQVTSLLFSNEKHFTGTRSTTYPFKANANNDELYDIPFKGYNIEVEDNKVTFLGTDNSSCLWSMYSGKNIDIDIIVPDGCYHTPVIGFTRYNTKIAEKNVSDQQDVSLRVHNGNLFVKHFQHDSPATTGISFGSGEHRIKISIRDNIFTVVLSESLSFSLNTHKLYGDYYIFICNDNTATPEYGEDFIIIDNITFGPLYALGNDNLALDNLITLTNKDLTDSEMQNCDINSSYRKGNLLRSSGTSIVPSINSDYNYKAILNPDAVDITINESAMNKEIRSAEVSGSTVIQDGVMDNFLAMKFINLEENNGSLTEIQTDIESSIHVCQDKDVYNSLNQLKPLSLRAYILNTHNYGMQPVTYTYATRQCSSSAWVGDEVYFKLLNGGYVYDLEEIGIWKYDGSNLYLNGNSYTTSHSVSNDDDGYINGSQRIVYMIDEWWGTINGDLGTVEIGPFYSYKVCVVDDVIYLKQLTNASYEKVSYNNYKPISTYSSWIPFFTKHYPISNYSNVPFYQATNGVSYSSFSMDVNGESRPIRVVNDGSSYDYVAIQREDGSYDPCGFCSVSGVMAFFLFKAERTIEVEEKSDMYYRFIIAETAENPFPTYDPVDIDSYEEALLLAESNIYNDTYSKYASSNDSGYMTPSTYAQIENTLDSFKGSDGLIKKFENAATELNQQYEEDTNRLVGYHQEVSDYGIVASYKVNSHHLSIFQQYNKGEYEKIRKLGTTRYSHKNSHPSSVIIETAGNLSADNCKELVSNHSSYSYPLYEGSYYSRDSLDYYRYYKLINTDSFQHKIVLENNYSSAIVSFVATKLSDSAFHNTFVSFTEGVDTNINSIMLNDSKGSIGLMVDSNGSIRIYTTSTNYSYLKDLKGNQVYLSNKNKVIINSYISQDNTIKLAVYINDEYINTVVSSSSLGSYYNMTPKIEQTNSTSLRRLNFYNANYIAHDTLILKMNTKFPISSYDFNDTSDIEMISEEHLGNGRYYYAFKITVTPYSITGTSGGRSYAYDTMRFVDIESLDANLSWDSSDPDVYNVTLNQINTFSVAAGTYNASGYINHLCVIEGMSSPIDSFVPNRNRVLKRNATEGMLLNKIRSQNNTSTGSLYAYDDLRYKCNESSTDWSSYVVLSDEIDLSKINYLEYTCFLEDSTDNAFDLGIMSTSSYSSLSSILFGAHVTRADNIIRLNKSGSISDTSYKIGTNNKFVIRVENTGSGYRARLYRDISSGRSSLSSYVTINVSKIYLVAVLKTTNSYIYKPQLKIDYKDE